MNPPVFLGAPSERELKLVRSAFVAHPRFFTSHLPADDEDSLREWARAMRDTPCSRRPVWLSTCAFSCMDELRRELPGARFVLVVDGEPGPAGSPDCLQLPERELANDPTGALTRVFDFLGERPPQSLVLLRRCA